ncbi:MAG: aminotransferase class III-fold pyridoxal phosphate-dependent enzyme [Desulfobacterales bacterium]|nr:aminotransferase class III-fold pyridoxal phosphate-dependent enzyme [Desulfobacterales bacterium]
MKFKKSTELLETAKALIPSASQTYSKNYKYYCEGAAPAFLERGNGALVTDVDGNQYLDFILGLGPVTIGYNNPEINGAIVRQLEKGISFSQPHPLEVRLAEKIVEIVPCAEMVKFLKNGSDATAAAVRLARAYTGRDLVFCSGYHGFHDWYVGATVNNRGVPDAVAGLTKTFPYNRIRELERLFEEHPGQAACVVMEPVSMEIPEEGYLETVRRLCDENGAVLVFDEVVTGFRVAMGGAQEYYGVTPDLCTMGKGIANGMPLSLVAGKKEIMSVIDSGAFVSTTFGGETLSLAAALATIEIMERENYIRHIWHLGQLWLDKVGKLIREHKLSCVVGTCGLPPHSGIEFKTHGNILPTDWRSLFIESMVAGSILSMGVNNFSLAHSEQDVDLFVNAVSKAFTRFQEALSSGSADHLLTGKKFVPIFARNGGENT